MIGSMVATGAMNILGFFPDFSTSLVSLVANVLIGVMIGRQIDRGVFSRALELGRPVFFQIIGIFVLSVVNGYMLFLMGSGEVTLITALISGAAGGIAEMIIFGMSIHADVAMIAFVHLFRVVIFLSIIPYIAIVCEKLGGGKPGEGQQRSARQQPRLFTVRDYILLGASALSGAFLGEWLNVPSGVLLGAMLASGAFALVINKRYRFHARLRDAAQIGLGIALGHRMTSEMVAQLGQMLLPALGATAIMLVGCTLLAFLLRANTGWDLTTCLICSAPAGLSQVIAYSDEIGVDPFIASVFHSIRIICIVSLYPWLIIPLMGA